MIAERDQVKVSLSFCYCRLFQKLLGAMPQKSSCQDGEFFAVLDELLDDLSCNFTSNKLWN